jgi:DNA invertase Pin-like site-specific DNA recombinase
VALACSRKAVLVAYNQSRLARSLGTLLKLVARLDAAGARVHTLTGVQIDESAPELALAWRIIGLIDEFRRVKDAETTSDIMRSHQANGSSVSSTPPYGYDRVAGDETHANGQPVYHLIPNPREQLAVERIKSLAGEKMGAKRIASTLQREGFKPRGERWYPSTIISILERELNAKR